MSDVEAAERQVARWVQPLADEASPCGPDLEYDNDFLDLTQATQGKPESQFGAAEPPDWRKAFDLSSELLERSRDLRIAISWARAALHVLGFGALPSGLRLIIGLVESQWDHVHPLPDPDDGDPYARVNALTLLREAEGLIGDLRSARVIDLRGIGDLTVRSIEVVAGLSPAREGETVISREQASQMLATAAEREPGLRVAAESAAGLVRQLGTLLNDRLGVGTAPDLKPLRVVVDAVQALMPTSAADESSADDAGVGGGDAVPAAAGGARRGLAGSVTSREEAIRAIDMICEYLERAEPANPAPLFLRRARRLINHNFLQLMKVLAPDALYEVAKVVGIDPETVENPDAP